MTFVSVATAQVITPFAVRYTTNDTGDIAIIGNTLLTCPTSASGCVAAQSGSGSAIDDNDYNMVNVDIDSDATTFNSSRATLTLPSGSTVLFAGLYWGADTSAGSSGSAAPSAALRTTISFLTPASSSYISRTGTQVGISGTRFHVFNDVTSLVQTGGSGTYGVANVQAGRGADRYAGWAMVVVYRAPGQAPRNLTVLDGYALVSSSNPNVAIPVSGFTTPPAGTVITRLGTVSYEGDLGLTGDALRLNSTTISDALNPSSNYFNSSITRLGTRINGKSPDFINQFGFDADVVDASGVLPNSSTSATINLTTGGETYFPGVVTFATELYAPNIPASKTVTDLNGGNVQPGDILEYTVSASNTGQDPATLVVLRDPIPSNTTYLPGSLQILTGANAGVKTDASADDQAEYDGLNNRVVFRLGTGANAANGGTLGVGAATSVRFRVTVNAATPNGAVITNQASISYTGQTLGGGFSGASSAPTVAVTSTPVLSAQKTVTLFADNDFNGVPSPGDVLRYQVVIANSGTGFSNSVVFNDTPDANTTLVAGSVATSQGSISSGNAGSPPVTINLGTIANGFAATVSFRVTINALPASVSRLSNQGTVSSTELPTLLTDDPSLGGSSDATVTAVTASPVLRAEKIVSLMSDNDADGVPSPGDRLLYQIAIANSGNAAVTGVTLTDIPDGNTFLVVGSVTASQGSITTGNMLGDTAVGVSVGGLLAGASALLTFQVDIANPVPSGVTQVANQGTVSSDQLPALLTDDPSVAGTSNPTRTSIVANASLSATKTDTLLVDADNNGAPSPGDTILYQVTITNSGNASASGVVFNDTPDVNTTLVSGSVATNRGSVTSGNSGTPPVTVNVGTLVGGGASATITFRVTVNGPLPAGVTQVTNQGSVTSNELPVVLTDNPTVAGSADATVTNVTAAPDMSATKTAALQIDADGDGVISPGDTLVYTVTITNRGNSAGTATFANDLLDPNAPLVVGSVQSSAGTVTSGNNPGDASVTVDVGTIPGAGGNAVISFRALIGSPLPANVTSVSNQAVVSGANFPTLQTDDPSTPASNDPTVSAVATSPIISMTKSVSLDVDTDSNGSPSPGDTLLYQILVRNSGNQAGSDVTLTDSPDVNSALVVGSVQTSSGTVTAGNLTGDTNVVVTISALPGGSDATISFRVTVSDPLPPGVTQVSNQAQVAGSNFPSEPSDDPSTSVQKDATTTALTASPSGSVEKTASLFVDADGDGLTSPGDTLLYLIKVANTGNAAATGAFLTDFPDVNTALVVGSFQVSQGLITSGNSPGDTFVAVDIGTVPGRGGTFTASFLVTVDDPLPTGVSYVANQAVGGSNELPLVVTNDPNTPAANDATVTAISAAPAGTATKVASLFTDADGDGVPSPGDTLSYRIDFTNTGSGPVTNAFSIDIPDPNTQLVVGSVISSQGTVTSGNNPGDTDVHITVGDIPARGGSVSVSFLVTIDNPLPPGVTTISNQAFGSSDQSPVGYTDDPSTALPFDATVTHVTAVPALFVDKTDALSIDADNDGVVSPGDTLQYVINIHNTGNTAATGAILSDTIDPHVNLVVGSVQTRAGSVTTGNNPGDTNVAVALGTIPAQGATVTVSFLVDIPDPLAPGVQFVANQAFVSCNETATVASTDPDTPLATDPTITLVTAIPAGRADKTAVLYVDADGDGVASPGDTLLYTLDVVNTGNGAGTGAVMSDTLDPNATLVVGSVQVNQGTITSGNNPGDTSVGVMVGTIPARTGRFTCSFLAMINSPLPLGVSQVSNQAVGSSNELPLVVSNDPSTAAPNDATVTQVTAQPSLIATKADSLFTDADSSGGASAGDTLLYTITIVNAGNTAASGIVFNDIPDANTSLVAGSVSTSQGSILSGNGGTPPVTINIGTIPGGGGSVVVSFRVLIDNPLPIGTLFVRNQGIVTSNELPAVVTNDGDTLLPSDPTITAVTAAPFIRPYKTAAMAIDADGDGIPGPGDTLQYSIQIRNSGSQPALSTILTDTPDGNTTLVAGSVISSQGPVTSGNGVGDTMVQVNLGTIPANGGTAVVTFQVMVNNPLVEGVTQVSNQAQVSGTNFAAQVTDDPSTPALNDATSTTIRPIAAINAAKGAVLLTDADNNQVPTQGDTLLYSITLRNNGNVVAQNVTFTDTPDPNTTLVSGSVKTTKGSVTSGNAGAPPVTIFIGDLAAAGGTVTISFAVTVNAPLPMGVVQVSNQGLVSADNVVTLPTDDPTTAAAADATITRVTNSPQIVVSKSVSLFFDADASGGGSPGDTLLYSLTIQNQGNATATALVFSDTPDANTTLVSGSVQTSAGTITGGNAGTPPVTINIGSLAGSGGTVTASFRVTVNNPLPPNTAAVSNQASISGGNFANVVSDDPSTAAAADATAFSVAGMDLELSKSHSGSFQVGVNARYTLIVRNVGTAPTIGTITVTDPLPSGLTFLSATASGWACSAAGQTVTCTRSTSISAGSSSSIQLNVAVGNAAFPTITNNAFLYLVGDVNSGNNDAYDPTTVKAGTAPTPTLTATRTPTSGLPGAATVTPSRSSTPQVTSTPTLGLPPDLGLTKSHVGAFTVGINGTYTLLVHNFGQGSTSGTTMITDPLPSGLTFVSGSGSGWSCSANGQTVTCSTSAVIPPGGETSVALTVSVGSQAYPTTTNTAHVSTARDGVTNNDDATDPTTVRLGATATSTVARPTATSQIPASRTPTPQAAATATSGPSLTPTQTALPTASFTPTPCEVAISKTHSGTIRPGRLAKFQLTWSDSCTDADTLTVADVLPDGMTLVAVSAVSDTIVSSSANTTTLTAPRRSGFSTATITVQVSSSLTPNTTICNRATLSDSQGRQTQSTDCVKIAPESAEQVLKLKGHSKARPGRELTYTARYFNVGPENTLSLTIPAHVTVIRILDPQPTMINGRTLTWQNLPIISGKVRVTVQLDEGLDFGFVLPAVAELTSGLGTSTANHDTVVILDGRNP